MLDAARLPCHSGKDTPYPALWQVLPQRNLRRWFGHSVTMAHYREQHGALSIERTACCLLSRRLVCWQGRCMCEDTDGSFQERYCRGVLHTRMSLSRIQSTRTDSSSSTPPMNANPTIPTSAIEQPKRGKSQNLCAQPPSAATSSSAWATST